MARRLPFAAIAVLLATTGAARATPQDYCEAYARDFADRGPREEAIYTARRDNALADCLFQFQPAASEPQAPPVVAPKQVKRVAKVQPEKRRRKVVRAPEPEIAEPLPEPAVIVAPDIEPPPKAAQTAKAAPAAAPRNKTLLAKLFPPKDGAAAPAPSKGGKLVPGSSAWLDYCGRKYASFNPETGTYKSYKGIERKCLVTD